MKVILWQRLHEIVCDANDRDMRLAKPPLKNDNRIVIIIHNLYFDTKHLS